MPKYNSLANDLDLGGGVLLFITLGVWCYHDINFHLDNGLFLNVACLHLTESS